MGDKGGEPVDMDTKLDFNKVSFFDAGGVFLEGTVVATYFIGRDAGGEGESFENGFFIIDFGEVFVDLAVGPEAEFEYFAANCDLLDEFGEDLWVVG